MNSILKMGLAAQQLQVNANRLTDADVANIKEAGLRLVCKPDPVKPRVLTLNDYRVMGAHTSPEAA